MIIYSCPKCGKELTSVVLTVFPPIHVKKCLNCGFEHKELDTVIQIPYEPTIMNKSE